MAILIGSRYSPARGRHAPGDLRDAFCEAIDAYEAWEHGAPEPTVELRERQVPISQVFGLLWNCTDCLRVSVYQQVCDLFGVEEPQAQTYAASARALRAAVLADTPPKAA